MLCIRSRSMHCWSICIIDMYKTRGEPHVLRAATDAYPREQKQMHTMSYILFIMILRGVTDARTHCPYEPTNVQPLARMSIMSLEQARLDCKAPHGDGDTSCVFQTMPCTRPLVQGKQELTAANHIIQLGAPQTG
jgi:hypothetical protein